MGRCLGLLKLIVYILSGLIFSFQYSNALELSNSAPDFTVAAEDGSQLSLSSLKGKVVYLDFWASWCGPCRQTLPWMNTIKSKFSNKNFEIVAINIDSDKKAAEKLLEHIKPIYKVGFDPAGQVAKQYSLPKMPSSFLIGADGQIKGIFPGFNTEQEKNIEHGIQELVK